MIARVILRLSSSLRQLSVSNTKYSSTKIVSCTSSRNTGKSIIALCQTKSLSSPELQISGVSTQSQYKCLRLSALRSLGVDSPHWSKLIFNVCTEMLVVHQHNTRIVDVFLYSHLLSVLLVLTVSGVHAHNKKREIGLKFSNIQTSLRKFCA